MNTDRFNTQLEEYGELHVTTAAGEEYHVHNHDTTATHEGFVHIDSKLGDWTFPLEGVEVEYPHSHKE